MLLAIRDECPVPRWQFFQITDHVVTVGNPKGPLGGRELVDGSIDADDRATLPRVVFRVQNKEGRLNEFGDVCTKEAFPCLTATRTTVCCPSVLWRDTWSERLDFQNPGERCLTF